MLINGVNDTESNFLETGNFLARLDPDIAYLAIPTRPSADRHIRPPDPQSVNLAFQIISTFVRRVELLTGYEGTAFSSSGDIRRDVLNITAVHPLRCDALDALLLINGADWQVIGQMLKNKEIIQIEYEGNVFFLKNFSHGN